MLPAYQCHWPEDSLPEQKITKSICSWSSKNWIAYSTGYENGNSSLDVNTVYILNPDMPWENFPINTGHQGLIEHLEWDASGDYLLTVDNTGMGKIWNQEKSLINNWTCLENCTIDLNNGGRICKIAWLNSTAHRYLPDFDKSGTMKEWFHRFNQNQSDLLLTSYKENNVGFVMITAERLVKVHFLNPSNKLSKQVYSDRLGTLKSEIISSDFVISDAGKLFVAAVTEPCMVELFSVTFMDGPNGLDISEEVFPCIVPYVTGEPDFDEYEITDVKCVKKCNPNFSSDLVVVSSKSATASSVKIYEIRKEIVRLHSRFQSQGQTGQPTDTVNCLLTIQYPDVQIEHISITSLQLSAAHTSQITSQTLLPKLLVLDNQGAVHLYSMYNLQQIAQPSSFPELKNDPFDSTSFAPTDHAMFSVSRNAKLTLLTFSNQLNSQDKNKAKSIVTMLQCCLAESRSPWDIMLHISTYEKPFIDQCLQQFVSEFNENDGNTQSLFRQSFSHFKALIFAILKDYKGVFESYNQTFLHNIYYHLTALLQNEKEINLLEKIHNICLANKKEFEMTKIVPLLDTKDVTFSGLSNLSTKPIIQWLTDYMLHLVRLLLATSHHHNDWKIVLQYFDASTFFILRKTCILFYILFQKNPNIQPVYVTMVNSTEVLLQLFKMISKLYAACLGDPQSGDALLSELPFSSLPLMYLNYPTQDPRGTVLSTTSFNAMGNSSFNHYDIQLTVDDWQTVHETALKNPLIMGAHDIYTQKKQIYDGIRLSPTSLVANESVKQCCRCAVLTIYNCHQTRSFNELWANSWNDNCLCGGNWKKIY
ncbi:mediator of RNA polymerase II transcription subunit 16-like [Clytia hemisphaerica]|uniref:Mediator complex subunit 16 n=1 Tax=Clytia hemisphaerica TaxID=252671 RepID=A0A7M6DRW2_9CNID